MSDNYFDTSLSRIPHSLCRPTLTIETMFGEHKQGSHIPSNFMEMTQIHSHFRRIEIWTANVYKNGTSFDIRLPIHIIPIGPCALVE